MTSVPKEHPPLLDVHPAHHAANSWNEFFVHIATIVLGLLIAIGLEQTVEYVHHRRLAGEARANIQGELIQNASILQQNAKGLFESQVTLERNLELLDSSTPDAQTLQALRYSWDQNRIADGAWSASKTDGSIALIPSKDIRGANYFYSSSIEMVPLYFAYFTDIDTASAIVYHSRASGKLNLAERDQLRALTASAIGRAKVLASILSAQLAALKGTNLDQH
jgi:hypothetical protein